VLIYTNVFLLLAQQELHCFLLLTQSFVEDHKFPQQTKKFELYTAPSSHSNILRLAQNFLPFTIIFQFEQNLWLTQIIQALHQSFPLLFFLTIHKTFLLSLLFVHGTKSQ
jgi:hypothetical protein